MSRGRPTIIPSEAFDAYAGGRSLPDVAAAFGVPISTLRGQLLRHGYSLRSRAEGVRLSGGKISAAHKGRRRTFSEEWRKNISMGRERYGNEHAKGVTVKPDGWVEYTRGPNKGRLVHVVIMENVLRRKLTPDECVHHIDHNKTNNDPSNLVVMTKSDHAKYHINHRLAKGERIWENFHGKR